MRSDGSRRKRRPPPSEDAGRVWTRQREELTHRYPDEMPAAVTVLLRDGREVRAEASDYDGFWRTRPLEWAAAREKYDRLTGQSVDAGLRDEIANAVRALDRIPVRVLSALLERVPPG